MSGSRIAAWLRRTVVSHFVPWVFRSRRLRSLAFKFVSELGIAYRRIPAVAEGAPRFAQRSQGRRPAPRRGGRAERPGLLPAAGVGGTLVSPAALRRGRRVGCARD